MKPSPWLDGLREGFGSVKFCICLIVLADATYLARLGVIHEMAVCGIFSVVSAIFCTARAYTDVRQPQVCPPLPQPQAPMAPTEVP